MSTHLPESIVVNSVIVLGPVHVPALELTIGIVLCDRLN